MNFKTRSSDVFGIERCHRRVNSGEPGWFRALARGVKSEESKATIDNLNARIRAWWIMIGIFSI